MVEGCGWISLDHDLDSRMDQGVEAEDEEVSEVVSEEAEVVSTKATRTVNEGATTMPLETSKLKHYLVQKIKSCPNSLHKMHFNTQLEVKIQNKEIQKQPFK